MTSPQFQNSVTSLQEFLRPFALNLTKNSDDTDDLLQETICKALMNEDKYQSGTNIKAWLYTIMKNIFINNYRKKSKMKMMTDTTDNLYFINSAQMEVTSGAESKLVMDDLQKVLSSLADEYRLPFLMHYEGFKYQEIAEKFDLPIGTVKSRIFLARQALKKKLKKINIERP